MARTAIGTLFDKETDPISLIKLKELYEILETATDKAEDVANVLEGVVLKSARVGEPINPRCCGP